MKRCTFLYKGLLWSYDLANTDLLIISAAHANSNDVLHTQGGKCFNRVCSLWRAAAAIQKTKVQIPYRPNGTAIEKAGERLCHFLRMIMLYEIVCSLAHKKTKLLFRANANGTYDVRYLFAQLL